METRSHNINFTTYSSAITITFYPDSDQLKAHGPLWIKSKALAQELHIDLGPAEYIAFCIDDFYTDLASIPRFLWPIVSPYDYYMLVPAIAHDYLYRKKTITLYIYNSDSGNMLQLGQRFIPQKAADRLIKEKMADFGAGVVKRNAVYATLRLVGHHAYEHTKDIVDHARSSDNKNNT